MNKKVFLYMLVLIASVPTTVFGQSQDAEEVHTPRHILWVIPNFRTASLSPTYDPLGVREKFKLAREDSFDRGTIALAAAFGGESQISRSNPSFGNGVGAYARYWSTAYADFAIGNYMTEAVFPTLLHQDPRYFRRGSGSVRSRLSSAVGQILFTRGDSGRREFNYSEWAGNSTAVAISMAYYPNNRRASDAASQLGTQIGVDLALNIVKEFWPSRSRKSSRATPVGTR